MKKIFISIIFGTFIFFTIDQSLVKSDIVDITSFGAPPSSTGAPGESTCAQSGCHDDSQIGDKSKAELLFDNSSISSYSPDQIYPISLHVQDPSINRFGFQLVALDDNGDQCGSFIISDSEHTQILFNELEIKGREYVTYKHAGTYPKIPGSHSWNMKWKAPSKGKGKVHFYFATVSANNDNSDKGDKVFLHSMSLKEQFQTDCKDLCKELGAQYQINAFIHQNNLIIQNDNPSIPILSTAIFSINGSSIMNQMVSSDINSEIIVPLHEFQKGLYILRCTTSASINAQAFLIQ